MPRGIRGNLEYLGIEGVAYPAHIFLVLFRIKGTRTIYEQTTRLETCPGIVYNLALQAPALLHILQAPFADGGWILAEHALARAGYIAENHVVLRFRLAEILRVTVGDDAIRPAPFRDVLQQYLGAIGNRLVAYEDAVSRQHTPHRSGFPARGSAEVEREECTWSLVACFRRDAGREIKEA